MNEHWLFFRLPSILISLFSRFVCNLVGVRYGAFFAHCGATSMGCTMEADDHAVHGELPNSP